jgi:mannitol/fructose-specific phosphotransferase system IIA component (Ntr-type)
MVIAILGKTIGGGVPALLLGFNTKGAFRIGLGISPRGEGALITCGIGLAIGVLNTQYFSASVFMIFLTIVIIPPLLTLFLKIQGLGTKKPVKSDDSVQETWNFETTEIADLVMMNLLAELRSEGFYVQTMNLDEGLSQARKDDIVISITEEKKSITISTAKTDMPFVKNEIFEVILALSHSIEKLKAIANPEEMKKNLLNNEARTTKDILALIQPEFINIDLKGETKKEIIIELVDMLATKGKLINREMVITDVLERENTMSTGMEHGIALPHGKTDGIDHNAVVLGIKKDGVDYDSMDGLPSRIFLLIVSPKKDSGLYMQFLAAIGTILRDETEREEIINANTPQEIVDIIRKYDNLAHK